MGSLLRTIHTRPRQVTCIATSRQRIIAACEDIIHIYDAVTGVLRQSLRSLEMVTKIKLSPDGSTLFFAHSFSVTMWDVQTGGHIHTFISRSEINDIAVSAVRIACGLSDGSPVFWRICTEEEGDFGLGNDQPVVAVYWLEYDVLMVATQNTLCVRNIYARDNKHILPIPGRVWGVVYWRDREEFLVGVSRQTPGTRQEECFFVTVGYEVTYKRGRPQRGLFSILRQSPTEVGGLASPVFAGGEIACITPGGGVLLFDTRSFSWTNRPPLLGAALSVVVPLKEISWRRPKILSKFSPPTS